MWHYPIHAAEHLFALHAQIFKPKRKTKDTTEQKLGKHMTHSMWYISLTSEIVSEQELVHP